MQSFSWYSPFQIKKHVLESIGYLIENDKKPIDAEKNFRQLLTIQPTLMQTLNMNAVEAMKTNTYLSVVTNIAYIKYHKGNAPAALSYLLNALNIRKQLIKLLIEQ